MIKYISLLITCLACLYSFGQNNQILYGFDHLPQTLMLNPGEEVPYQKHIGVPLLSNVFLQIGSTNSNVNYANVIENTDNYLDVMRNIYAQGLSSDDHFKLYQRLEVFNVGMRLSNSRHYLSFGYYQEADGFARYPEQMAELFFEGNDPGGIGVPDSNSRYEFDEITGGAFLNGVLHVGLSSEINEKLTLGARFKVISSSINVDTRDNKGYYQLESHLVGYSHHFEDISVGLNSGGLWNNDGHRIYNVDNTWIKGLLFAGGNIGVGLDLGMTYHFENDIDLTASVLDLDYITYHNHIKTYEIDQDFVLPSIDYFDPTPGDELNYWEDVFDPYHDAGMIPIDTLQTSYSVFKSPKILTGLSKTFYRGTGGRKSAFRNVSCEVDGEDSDILTSEVGIQTYTSFRPSKMIWALTAFYSRELNKHFNAKVTYTVDEISKTNIGFGLSTNFNKFNLYVSADNLLDLLQYKESHYQSFQIGMNFKFY